MWLKNSRFKNVGPAVTPDGPTGNHNYSLWLFIQKFFWTWSMSISKRGDCMGKLLIEVL